MAHQTVNPKLVDLLDKLLKAIVESETARGLKIVRPGDAPWFRAGDWRAASIASIDRKRVRLVLLHAFESNRGALTRTIAGIKAAGMIPAVIDPTRELAATLTRRGWTSWPEGATVEDRETVWCEPGNRS